MIGNLNEHLPLQATALRRNPREPSRVAPALTPLRYWLIGLILAMALLAFEAFNFDTTKYALESLLGSVSFMGFGWATILAIAFCGIDFAGLLRVFTPDEAEDTKPEVWYLMAAWLMGATMNAIMTWYAVSLTLVENNIGNEILAREQLLTIVPIFVAMLVWLTRILFIGALSVAGGQLLDQIASVQVNVPERRVRPVTPLAIRPKPTIHSARPARIVENPNRSAHRPVHLAIEPTFFEEDDDDAGRNEVEQFVVPILPDAQVVGLNAR